MISKNFVWFSLYYLLEIRLHKNIRHLLDRYYKKLNWCEVRLWSETYMICSLVGRIFHFVFYKICTFQKLMSIKIKWQNIDVLLFVAVVCLCPALYRLPVRAERVPYGLAIVNFIEVLLRQTSERTERVRWGPPSLCRVHRFKYIPQLWRNKQNFHYIIWVFIVTIEFWDIYMYRYLVLSGLYKVYILTCSKRKRYVIL